MLSLRQMEDLNKHQLILLTLLVSFVTSIATGIITFSLLQQAPVEVTQTINRVVERTIEKVATEEGNKSGGTKEVVTTVVSEEDRVLEAIDKNGKSIVRVRGLGADGNEIVTGLGLVVSEDGLIVLDKRSYPGGSGYTILFADGKSYSISKSYFDPNSQFVFVKIGKPTAEKYTFYPAKFGSSSGLKLGQSIIAISGKSSNSVSIGRVAEVQKTTTGDISKFISDIAPSRHLSGSPLLNLSGEVVGLEAPLAEGDDNLAFFPASIIQNSLKTASAELAK